MLYLLDIGPRTQTTQKDNSLLGLVVFLNLVGNDQRKFRDIVDQMTCIIFKSYWRF